MILKHTLTHTYIFYLFPPDPRTMYQGLKDFVFSNIFYAEQR
jgi:hypothetical protein